MKTNMRAGSYAAVPDAKMDALQRARATTAPVHSLREGTPVVLRSRSGQQPSLVDDEGTDPGDDEGDDLDDSDDDFSGFDGAAAHAAALQEQAEMRARFTFREDKKRSIGNQLLASIRRKRRLLMRNENLRFRELHRPPEPIAVITFITVVTVVSLILTKSWPFY